MKKRFIVSIFIVVLLFNLSVISTSQPDTFKKFPNKYFVEVGSFKGDGIERALQAGFSQVYSIEISEQFFNKCKKRFSKKPQVKLFLGDSAKILYKSIKKIDESITFWLDGHYCVGTVKDDEQPLILQELEQIKKHSVKTHTILIDDVRLFGTEYFDFVTLDEIAEKILEINPDYEFFLIDGSVKNDILVARVKS